MVEKYNVSLKKLLHQGISEPKLNDVLVYKFRKKIWGSLFFEQFRNHINHYKIIWYNIDFMRQTACPVVNPVTVESYDFLFNCTAAVHASDSITALHKAFTGRLVLDTVSMAWSAVVQQVDFLKVDKKEIIRNRYNRIPHPTFNSGSRWL